MGHERNPLPTQYVVSVVLSSLQGSGCFHSLVCLKGACCDLLCGIVRAPFVASLLLVVWPGAPSSFCACIRIPKLPPRSLCETTLLFGKSIVKTPPCQTEASPLSVHKRPKASVLPDPSPPVTPSSSKPSPAFAQPLARTSPHSATPRPRRWRDLRRPTNGERSWHRGDEDPAKVSECRGRLNMFNESSGPLYGRLNHQRFLFMIRH